MSCPPSVRQEDNNTRRSSTPSKRAWEPMEGEETELRNIRTSQGDLNKNIKGASHQKYETDGQKTVGSEGSNVSSEVRLRSVELGVEESSPKSKGDLNRQKEQKESATNGVPDVAVKNGQKSILGEKQKDVELAKADNCGTDCCSRAWNLLTRVFKSKRFESDKLESLYQRYIFRLNQKFASCLIVLLLILSLVLVLFQFLLEKHRSVTNNTEGILMAVFAVIYTVLLFIVNRSGSSQAQLKWISYVLLAISFGIVLVVVLSPHPDHDTTDDRKYYSPSDGVWITIFFIYMTYTMLPVRMRIAVLGGCLLPTIHLISSAAVNADHAHLWRLVSTFSAAFNDLKLDSNADY